MRFRFHAWCWFLFFAGCTVIWAGIIFGLSSCWYDIEDDKVDNGKVIAVVSQWCKFDTLRCAGSILQYCSPASHQYEYYDDCTKHGMACHEDGCY